MVKSKKSQKSQKNKKSHRKSNYKGVRKIKHTDPYESRRKIHGEKFTQCNKRFTELLKKFASESKSGHSSGMTHQQAVKYLKNKYPECVEIIGDWILNH